MDATKQFDIQRQIRNNNEDFHHYARELKLWESEMKRKDEQLSSHSSSKDVPQIRKKAKKEDPNLKSKRISGFDYSSWDKFDVDKVCEEMDQADSDEDEDTDVEEEDLDRIATAVYNKEQGNKLVKEGKWGEAIEKYNVAIQTYPHDAVFYANRALCFLKMKNYVSAESDCNSSLKLDNSYVKAYLRRASARRSLSQFAEARNDILKVLQLEPNNKQAEVELSELSRKLNIPHTVNSPNENMQSKSSDLSKSLKEEVNHTTSKSRVGNTAQGILKPLDLSWVPAYDTSVYTPVPRLNIPPHQRSKKPLVKVNIIEPESTGISSSIISTSTTLIEDKTRKLQIIDDKKKEDLINIKQEPENMKDDLKSETEERRKKLEILESAWNELQNSNPYKKILNENVKVKKEPTVNLVKNESLQEPHTETVNIPCAPKTCSQFELHWRTLKSNEENLYLYLKQIKGSELPAIFKDGLETFTFLDILQCLCGKFVENGDIIGEYLQGLANTPRLASIVMLMTQSEKSLLSKLLNYCEEKHQLNTCELNQLIQAFEL